MEWIKRLLNLTLLRLIKMADFAGFGILIFIDTILHLKYIIKKRHEILMQMYNAGVRTFIVVSIVAMFTGMILTLHSGIEMKRYNMQAQVGNLVMASLTREMGPFTAAIILIAAVGSAMAAEIGTMKVSEEIDALEIMSISPVGYLVMPRVVALAVMMPIASIYTTILGTLGGGIIAQTHLDVTFSTYYMHALQSLHFKAVYVGLFKAFVFGIFISCISCAHGLKAVNGASGVGKATRNSVVASFLIVLISGYIITEIFFREGLGVGL